MIELLTTTVVPSAIETLVRSARKRIVILSPENRFSADFVDRLRLAEDRGAQITLYFGTPELDEKQDELWRELARAERASGASVRCP